MARLGLWWLVFALGSLPVGSQDFSSAAEAAKLAEAAIAEESYDLALRVLQEGRRRFPDSLDLARILGSLYLDKKVYSLAASELHYAEQLDGTDPEVLSLLGRALGYLNRDEDATLRYERLVALRGDDAGAVSDLAWMYFKTHRLRRAEAVLAAGVARIGLDKRLAMTMGTVYAGLYDYSAAKNAYQRAIDMALVEGEAYFASVAYYNLAILEKAFHRYDEALLAASRSVVQAERAPGHLMRGELYLGRLDHRRAFAAYERAAALDDTPLARLNQAITFRRFGFLEEAGAIARELLADRNTGWMYYFGVDPLRHRMDLHLLLRDYHAGRANLAAVRAYAHPAAWLKAAVIGIRDRILAFYHDLEYSACAERVAKRYAAAGSEINAAFTFYRAARRHPAVALRQLSRARELETLVNPSAMRFYRLEEGTTRNSPKLLGEAIAGLIDPWERSAKEEALVALWRALDRPFASAAETEARLDAALEIYRLNPGALRQAGIRLPVRLFAADAGRLSAALDAVFETRLEANLPTLTVSRREGRIFVELAGLRTASVPATPADPAAEANRIADEIYQTR